MYAKYLKWRFITKLNFICWFAAPIGLILVLLFMWNGVSLKLIIPIFVVVIVCSVIIYVTARHLKYKGWLRKIRQLRQKVIRKAGDLQFKLTDSRPIDIFNRRITKSLIGAEQHYINVFIVLTGNLSLDEQFWTDKFEKQIVKWIASDSLIFVERKNIAIGSKRIVVLIFERVAARDSESGNNTRI